MDDQWWRNFQAGHILILPRFRTCGGSLVQSRTEERRNSMERITDKQLKAIVDRINRVTGSPMESWARDGDKNKANVGNYHISYSYGGVELDRMVNERGGVTCPLGSGHVPKRELANRMWAFLAGLESHGELVKP